MTRDRPIVALLTDFGTQDVFVGVMKGVILEIVPDAHVVDVTHAVPPQDVRLGSLFLRAASPYFPEGTVHVAVVDPGVGSARRAIAVRTRRAFYVAPDNGLLTGVIREEGIEKAVVLTETRYFLPKMSGTFHGRDLFAPVGAYLANGVPIESFGPALSDPILLADDRPHRLGDTLHARIVFADRFGNLVTNVSREDVPGGEIESIELEGVGRFGPPQVSYSAVREGGTLSLWNSFGLLELALNGGSLAERVGWTHGQDQRVTVRLRRESPPAGDSE